MKNNQNFEVYATVTNVISLNVQAQNENEAKEKSQRLLSDLSIVESKLELIRANGEIVSPRVHDYSVDEDITIFED